MQGSTYATNDNDNPARPGNTRPTGYNGRADGQASRLDNQGSIAQYLEREAWYLAGVQKGIDDADAGRVISHEEMGARLKAKGFNVAP